MPFENRIGCRRRIPDPDRSGSDEWAHSPAALGDLFRQMQDAVMIGQKAARVGQ